MTAVATAAPAAIRWALESCPKRRVLSSRSHLLDHTGHQTLCGFLVGPDIEEEPGGVDCHTCLAIAALHGSEVQRLHSGGGR